MKTLVVIPARGGSKSIPRKNLAEVAGRPLISYVIEAALAAERVDRVVVSTEDEEIAAVVREWGAEVPFLRPVELASDEVSLGPVVVHALEALDGLGFRADAVLSAQATSPFLEGGDFDAMIEKLTSTGADSVVSVQRVEHEHPFWVKRLEDDRVRPFNEYTNESYLQRQDPPGLYLRRGALSQETPRRRAVERPGLRARRRCARRRARRRQVAPHRRPPPPRARAGGGFPPRPA